NYLQPFNGFPNHALRPGDRNPGKLHLWQSNDLRKSAQSESKHFAIADKTARYLPTELVVQKHLVHDQCQLPASTKFVDGLRRGITDVGAGRIVGIYQDNRARLRGNGFLERVHINMPAVVVEKLIRDRSNVLERGQVFEQWIARRWNQHL